MTVASEKCRLQKQASADYALPFSLQSTAILDHRRLSLCVPNWLLYHATQRDQIL